MKKHLSKTILSLALSTILFCMPVGAFLANHDNAVDIYAQQETNVTENSGKEKVHSESESKTEDQTEKTTASSNSVTMQECTCKEKCSQSAKNEECEVCKVDYSKCDYVSPNVKITIRTPNGWYKETAKVSVLAEDVFKKKDFAIKTVEAKIGQNGNWTDITEDMYLEISENSSVYVLVTDQNGNTYEKNRYIKCFDFDKPTLNAAVSDGLLSIQAQDTDSGIKAIYVNGYEFKKLTNGVLNIRLQQFDAGYQYFTIQAMDNAGNMSEVYKTANPYYTDPETKDSTQTNPAEQLPVNSEATKPSSATAQVTEHTKTDSAGNQIISSNTASNAETDKEKGKEFYTIQTDNEKIFYLVIDRDGDEEKVYFLTEISENDLLNVTTENSETLPKNSAALESAIPVSQGALSNNNVETDQTNVAEDSEQKENAGEDEEEKKDDVKEENSMTTYLVLGVAAVVVIAVYFKVVRKKKDDFLDEEDDEEYDEEYENEDDEEDTEDDFFERAEESEEEE